MMKFSLFYFACDDGAPAEDKFRLLIEGAKFADENNFAAIWTPERHFHALGGLYPNPSVTSAALAMVTERVQLRAGSVVLPLHNPIRVAEEWSVVDNLSKGRVAVSFASGWHANDFVLAPESYPDRRHVMTQQIEIVRKLWRGESVHSTNGSGEEIAVKIFPRPVQSELPIWITASNSPDTFRLAGELGANLLTHLLGQSIDDLAAKMAIYRQSWRDAGHRREGGSVALMLHTFVGEDFAAIQETVRQPFLRYLEHSAALMGKARKASVASIADSRNAAQPDINHEATRREFEPVMEYVFQRYIHENGLIGTPDACVQMVDRLAAIGVDEIACMIDFGVEPDRVLQSLQFLDEVRERSNRGNTFFRCGPASPSLDPIAGNSSHTPPRTATEKKLAQIWSSVLGRNHLSVADSFFDLGGQSMHAMQVAARISEVFQVDLPVSQFFDAPTIGSLAPVIEEKLAEKDAEFSRDGAEELSVA